MAAANAIEHNDIPGFERLLVDNLEDGIIDDEEFLMLVYYPTLWLQVQQYDLVRYAQDSHALSILFFPLGFY